MSGIQEPVLEELQGIFGWACQRSILLPSELHLSCKPGVSRNQKLSSSLGFYCSYSCTIDRGHALKGSRCKTCRSPQIQQNPRATHKKYTTDFSPGKVPSPDASLCCLQVQTYPLAIDENGTFVDQLLSGAVVHFIAA